MDQAVTKPVTSVSEVDWNIEPERSSSSRKIAPLTKLPLCAMAMGPCEYSTTKGCAFLR